MSTCDDLDDSVPDIVFHLCVLDQLDHHVHVPDQVLSEFLSQNGDLQHQIVVDVRIHPVLEIPQQLCHDRGHVVGVADQIQ